MSIEEDLIVYGKIDMAKRPRVHVNKYFRMKSFRRVPTRGITPVSANTVPEHTRQLSPDEQKEEDKHQKRIRSLRRQQEVLAERTMAEEARERVKMQKEQRKTEKMNRYVSYEDMKQRKQPLKTLNTAVDILTKFKGLASVFEGTTPYEKETKLRIDIAEIATKHPEKLTPAQAKQYFSNTGQIPYGWDTPANNSLFYSEMTKPQVEQAITDTVKAKIRRRPAKRATRLQKAVSESKGYDLTSKELNALLGEPTSQDISNKELRKMVAEQKEQSKLTAFKGKRRRPPISG